MLTAFFDSYSGKGLESRDCGANRKHVPVFQYFRYLCQVVGTPARKSVIYYK